MRLLTSITRLTLTTCAVLLPWLLNAPAAEAANRPGAQYSQRRVICDPRTPPRRALNKFARRDLMTPRVVRHFPTRIQRPRHTVVIDDDDAIQNDGTAMEFPVRRSHGELRALALVSASGCSLPRRDGVARRSPRGPPAPPTIS